MNTTRARTRARTRTHTHTLAGVYIYICIYIHLFIYSHTQTHTHTSSAHIIQYTGVTCVLTRMSARAHRRTHTHARAHLHSAHVRAHARRQTHTCISSPSHAWRVLPFLNSFFACGDLRNITWLLVGRGAYAPQRNPMVGAGFRGR